MARKRVSKGNTQTPRRRVVSKRIVITPLQQLFIVIGIILFLSLFSWLVYAANNAAVLGAKTAKSQKLDSRTFTVKKVTVVGAKGNGACKSSKNIKGQIQVNSKGTLTYQWVVNGQAQPVQTVTVNHPGTINVSLYPKKVPQSTPAVTPTLTSGTVMLGTITPNVMSAQKDLATLCSSNKNDKGNGKGKDKGNGLSGFLNGLGLGHGNSNGKGKGK